MPTCAEATAQLSLPERRKDMDDTSDATSWAETRCYWYDRNKQLASGWEITSHVDVRWHLRRSVSYSENATEVQEKEFTDLAQKGRPAASPAFADQAFWASLSADDWRSCALSRPFREPHRVYSPCRRAPFAP